MKNLMQFHDKFWNHSLRVLANVERTGMQFDSRLASTKAEHASEVAFGLYTKLNTWAADYSRQLSEQINWASSQQLSEFLYDFKAFPISPVIGTMNATKKNRDNERSTSEAALDWLSKNVDSGSSREYLTALLDWKRTTKLIQFMTKLPTMVVNGRLHCSLGPKTDTGRLTSSKPNMQQIPTRNDRFKIRECFVAAPGYSLVVADYSQLEMYVMAHYLEYLFNDRSLSDDLSNGDVHTNAAFRMFPNQLRALGATVENIKDDERSKKYRDQAKTINYAMPYGKTAQGLGTQILDEHGRGIGTYEATKLIDQYFEAYPGMDTLFNYWKDQARKTGFVHTLLGRTRPLPGAKATDWTANADLRRAVNTPVQGSAADIVTAAMLRCNTIPGLGPWYNKVLADLGTRLCMQVHDELIFEVPKENAQEACAHIKETMENPFEKPLKVQLKVDAQVGANWGEAK